MQDIPASRFLHLPVEPSVQVTDLPARSVIGPRTGTPVTTWWIDSMCTGGWARPMSVSQLADRCGEGTYTRGPNSTHPCAAERSGECSPDVTTAVGHASGARVSTAQRASANSGCLTRLLKSRVMPGISTSFTTRRVTPPAAGRDDRGQRGLGPVAALEQPVRGIRPRAQLGDRRVQRAGAEEVELPAPVAGAHVRC